MSHAIHVPRLAKGRGYKGPEFYGCCNTGMAPAIFHSRTGKYVVGQEMYCHDAMQEDVLLSDRRVHGEGRQRVWIFKGRPAAVNKFMALCGAMILDNAHEAQYRAELRAKAAQDDLTAALAPVTTNTRSNTDVRIHARSLPSPRKRR